jgi:hypothetical protein
VRRVLPQAEAAFDVNCETATAIGGRYGIIPRRWTRQAANPPTPIAPIDAGVSTGGQITPEGKTVHPGDSAVQLAAEPLMIAAVAEAINVPLTKQRLTFPGGSWCEVDGVSADGTVLVEAFAHQGKMIGGQLKKVCEDAFKLVTLAKGRGGVRLIVAFADYAAARSFMGKSWKAEALKTWGVEVLVVEVQGDVRDGILEAQVRQFR